MKAGEKVPGSKTLGTFFCTYGNTTRKNCCEFVGAFVNDNKPELSVVFVINGVHRVGAVKSVAD